jgi:hypothetical protein
MHVGTAWFSGRARAFNSVLLGPISTLHKTDGSLAIREFWYEPNYFGPSEKYRIDKRKGFAAFQRKLTRQMSRHPAGKVLENFVVEYGSHLDEIDYDLAIVKLWSLLERLTGVNDALNADQVVKRACAIYRDGARTMRELQQVRFYRNSLAHEGVTSPNNKFLLHFLRYPIQDLLIFHCRNTLESDSIAQTGEVLEFASAPEQSLKRFARLRSAMKLVSGRRPRTPKKSPENQKVIATQTP